MTWTRTHAALALGALALGASSLLSPASAFLPAAQNQEFEILLPSIHPDLNRTGSALTAQQSVARVASERLGGSWTVSRWDGPAGTPAMMYGSGVDLGLSLRSDADAESAARQVIDSYPELFGARNSELQLVDVRRARGKVAAHFQQTYRGLEVVGAKVQATFMEDRGRLFAMGSSFHADIDLDTNPIVGSAEAINIARNGVLYDPATDEIDGEPVLLVVPVPTSAASAQYRVAWRVRVVTADPIGIWVTHVDARTGEIFWRYNDVHFFTHEGHTDSDTQPVTYCDGYVTESVPYVNLEVDGVPTQTDENGDWSSESELETVSVYATLDGPYVTVFNQGGSQGAFSGSSTAGTPADILFDDTNSQADERTVFDGVNDLHDFFLVIDPEYDYSQQTMISTVSIPLSCNAYWNGTINFYQEGDGCANTGEIQGVVQHEFGHGVQNSLIGGQGNEGLGEGNSDVLANIITQESIIGRGFGLGNCSSGIRNSFNNLRYPEDVAGQGVHAAGRVIAGFHWDLMMGLQDRYGVEEGTIRSAELWHYARKLSRPEFQPDQVLAVLILDDDDGDLTNGTPHYVEIAHAAERHGFDTPAAPGVHFVGGRLLNQETSEDPYAITATPYSTEGDIVGSSVSMIWRVDGGTWQTLPMSDNGDGTYTASMPSQSVGSFVEYYLEADDTSGFTGYAPEAGVSAPWDFFVVTFYDALETESGWVVGAADDDATRGIWERVDPVGTAAQPSDDATPAWGTQAFITGQHSGSEGGWQGQSDVDGGKTTLFSPVYDITGSTEFATLRYKRWYTNDTGGSANEDPWVVMITGDGGDTWIELENTLVSDRSWALQEFDLLALFPEPGEFQVMFLATDYDGNTIIEAGVDEFTVVADLGQTTVDVQPGAGTVPGAAYLAQARPNPFNPQTTIRYGLAQAGDVSLTVYDVSGREVRSLVAGAQAAGHHSVSWDGRDNVGRLLPAGVYYYRVAGPQVSVTRAVTLLR